MIRDDVELFPKWVMIFIMD